MSLPPQTFQRPPTALRKETEILTWLPKYDLAPGPFLVSSLTRPSAPQLPPSSLGVLRHSLPPRAFASSVLLTGMLPEVSLPVISTYLTQALELSSGPAQSVFLLEFL